MQNSNIIISILALGMCIEPISNATAQSENQLKIAAFEADATPPIGSPVAYAITRSIVDPLSARGVVVFIGNEQPIVLCAVDWIGIANEGLDAWRKKLADAAHTNIDRVSIHVLHQHDGVNCDFTTEKLMKEYNAGQTLFDHDFQNKAIQNTADAVATACTHPEVVTHIGFGQTKIDSVASNRRILGKDGKVEHSRWSSGNDSVTIAAPEGLIDPWLKCVSFWNNEKPLVVMTYYATHPQSYYGKGDVTCEFVGIARNRREKATGNLPHIHFNGAGGNVTTGKYNDGSDSMRYVLAHRMETAMQRAWEETQKVSVPKHLAWKNTEVALPVSKKIDGPKLRSILADVSKSDQDKFLAAAKLAWYLRCKEGNKVNISSLQLGKIWLLNVPGELFVEYQLAAQKLKPGEQVCTAAYEEYGPEYIGTAISYSQGGYETSETASGTAPEVEEVIMKAIKNVLK